MSADKDNDKDFFWVSKSHQNNIDIAREVLNEVAGLNRNRSVVLGLQGDLGAGKTTWTRGLVDALGGDPEQVQSPTYILMRDYQLGENLYQFQSLHHIDLYRLNKASDTKALMLDEAVNDQTKIFVIEWADKYPRSIPKLHASLLFETINDFTKTIELKD